MKRLLLSSILVLFLGIQARAQNTNMGGVSLVSLSTNGNYYDDGGSASNYTVGVSGTNDLRSATGYKIRITINSCVLSLTDTLLIYNGSGITSPLLATLTGTSTPGVVYTAQYSDLFFSFKAHAATAAAGWNISFVMLTPTISWNSPGVVLERGTSLQYSISGSNTTFTRGTPLASSPRAYLALTHVDSIVGTGFTAVNDSLLTVTFSPACDTLSNCCYTFGVLANGQGTLTGTPSITVNENVHDTIQGSVKYSGGLINQGYAKLYYYRTDKHMASADSVQLVAGAYKFVGVRSGMYLLYVKPDTLLYPGVSPTCFDSVTSWKTASLITACTQLTTANLRMCQDGLLNGPGKLSGQLVEGSNYHAPGNPIKGIDVGLDHDPSGGIIAHATTNANGMYYFSKVPPGNYVVNINIPGLPMDSTYHIVVTATDTVFKNLDLSADSAKIYIKTVVTGIQGNAIYDNQLKIYPNPFSGNSTLELTVENTGPVTLELYNSLGELLKTIEHKDLQTGTYSYSISGDETNLCAGIYIIKLRSSGSQQTYRMVKLK